MSEQEISTETIEVVANGRPCRVAPGSTVAGLLEELDLDRDVVIVERNGAIVARDRLDDVGLEAGDRLEIVHIVGGG